MAALGTTEHLFGGSKRSVRDSYQEVLFGRSVGILVVNQLGRVDENDSEILLLFLVLKLKLVQLLRNVLLKFSWLGCVFLDYFFSSIEHLCFSIYLGKLVSSL